MAENEQRLKRALLVPVSLMVWCYSLENATKEEVLEEDESKNEENGGRRKSGCVRLLSRQRHGQLTAWSGQGK